MRKVAITLLMAFVVPHALAENEEKHGHVGLASFATVISNNISGFEDDELSGFALFGGFATNDNFGGRLTLASQDHDDTSDIDVRAFEFSLMGGTGLATEGFKAYGSLGLFNETWEFSNSFYGDFDERFNGLMFGGGIGYNWEFVALDFWLNIRDSSDYEDFMESTLVDGVDASAVSGGLGLSARF